MDPPVVATKSEPQAPDHGNAPEEPEDSKEGLQQFIQEMNDPSVGWKVASIQAA